MEIKHFGHEHPLILAKELSNIILSCKACAGFIEQQEYPLSENSFYTCSLRCEYYSYCLHKTCAEAPDKIQHPLHPDHPLTLLALLPNTCTNQNCNCCGHAMNYLFTYHCSQCQFNLHVLCALPLVQNFKYISDHQHPLIHLGKTALLFCEACGTKHEGVFYTCPTCIANSHSQFFIHRNCASLPQTIKHKDHSHDLILGYSIPPEYARHSHQCEICKETLNPKYWVYYCGGCRHFLHVICATTLSSSNMEKKKNISQIEPSDETDDRVEKSMLESIHFPEDESTSLVSHLLKNMKLEDTQREKIVKFNPSCHEHPLTLCDDQSEDEEMCYDSKLSLLNNEKDDKICSGCIQHISNSPFYSCAQCDVFLHKCCAELPTAMEKPRICQHPLIFIAKASTPFNLFLCKCCNMYCNGFAYHCDSCDFYLDIKCALLPSAITHEGHQYPQHLLQIKKVRYGKKCSLCKVSFGIEFAYGCNKCSFISHIRCALVPHTIRQKYDELHRLTLRYSPVEDHPQEYVCEVCERDLDPKVWFYHCTECDISIHTGCTYVGEQYCNVKFGGIFHTNHHEHQLTLVHKTKKPSRCYACRRDIKCDFVFHADSTLECSQCNFKIHLKCALPKHKKF